MSRSLNKEIISTGCIALIILLSSLTGIKATAAESKIITNKKIIVIDPGHGGEDTGIIVNSDLYEKTYTLELAEITARLLKNQYTVLFTRTSDLKVPNFKRTSFANIKKADIFISLHAKKEKGNEDYFIIYAPPLEAQPLKSGELLPWEAEHLKYIKKSKAAAENFVQIFSQQFKTDFGVISAPLEIFQGAQMPAVFIEVMSMEDLMGEPGNKTKLQNYAKAIAKSLEEILK